MIDMDEARKRWLAERQTYEALGKLIEEKLREAVKKQGIWCNLTSRPKEPHSLLKKLLKGKHTYETIPDKVGARCIVRHLSDLDVVVSVARKLFECSEIDSKLEKLAEDRVGYCSIHIDLRLRDQDPEAANYPPNQYRVELQVRTLGQHLWAEMAHDSFYKSDETLSVFNSDVRRRANLMSGLIEVADREFDRLNRETALEPQIELYKELEQYYYKLTARRPDPELSLQVISLLMPLYKIGEQEIAERIRDFFANHEQILHSVYDNAAELNVSAFFYQPEVLMICERLEADQLATRKIWNTRFPERELESIANAFGISFD